MKALVTVFALLVLTMPISAGPIELPTPNLFDQLYSWFTATWEAMGPVIVPIGDRQSSNESVDPATKTGQDLPQSEMGPMIVPSGSSVESDPSGNQGTRKMGPFIDPFGCDDQQCTTQEMGPLIDPLG